MAIVFNKELNPDTVNFAFNNNIVEFYSDSSVAPDNASITLDGVSVIIYPNPNGIFRYNLKELIISLINKDNYADNLETDLGVSYLYNWTNKITVIGDIVTTINLSNDTQETDTRNIKWLSGYLNLDNYKENLFREDFLISYTDLMQVKNGDAFYDYYIKYWEGYPFDVSLWQNSFDVDVTNETNSLNYNFGTSAVVNRLVFSDGDTSSTIEDVFPLTEGVNNLNFRDDFNVNLYKEEVQCPNGLYIKWVNSFGGWSYWLFPKGQTDLKTKDRGVLFNDNNDIQDTVSKYISLGKDSSKSIKVKQQRIKEQYKIMLEDLLDSAKVYMFTGVPFSSNEFNDWLEVELNDGSFRVENTRSDLYELSLEFGLPQKDTRSL